MSRFLIRRSVQGLLTLWVVVSAVFFLYFASSPDPARLIAGKQATAESLAEVRHTLGLDQPIFPNQYIHFLGRLVFLDCSPADPCPLGISFRNHEPVTNLMATALPVDVSLALGAAVIWFVGGVSIGVLSARRPRTMVDRSATVFVLTGLSMPTFIIGLLLIYLLFYVLYLHGIKVFVPPGTYTSFFSNPFQWARDLILPWLTLAFVTAATYTRLTRSSLLETLGEDYIRTARAKGLNERRVVYRHGLRAALTPVLTQFGIDIAGVLGGAIITETVFALNGIGRLAVVSIFNQDLPVVIGIVIAASTFVIVANILVDALYAVLDPRVRLA